GDMDQGVLAGAAAVDGGAAGAGMPLGDASAGHPNSLAVGGAVAQGEELPAAPAITPAGAGGGASQQAYGGDHHRVPSTGVAGASGEILDLALRLSHAALSSTDAAVSQ